MQGILFKEDLYRAVVAGEKTQTRRLAIEGKKPRFKVGEKVFLKEPWADYHGIIKYRFDNDGFNPDCVGDHWHNKMFMPAAFARTWIEITGVRKEPLQEITQEDAKAEGTGQAPHRPSSYSECKQHADGSLIRDCYRCAFQLKWNQINGPKGYAWDKNPFVWVYDFKLVNNQ